MSGNFSMLSVLWSGSVCALYLKQVIVRIARFVVCKVLCCHVPIVVNRSISVVVLMYCINYAVCVRVGYALIYWSLQYILKLYLLLMSISYVCLVWYQYISSSTKVFFGYRTCFCGIWNTVILVFDVYISNLFCVSQVTMRESSVLMLCAIVVMSVLSVSWKVS